MFFLCRVGSRQFQNARSRYLMHCCSWQQENEPNSNSPLRRLREYSTNVDNNSQDNNNVGSQDESNNNDDKFTISFEEYRKLRKTLKVRARVAGLPMAFLGMGLSSAIHVTLNPRMFEMTPEEIKPILGMDPIMFAALCGVGSGIVGYLIGGTVFTATWKLVARNKFREIQRRDEDFFKRLRKHRFSEVNKYEDDYYGDKINNLSDYRQWIRKQQKRKEAQDVSPAPKT